VSKRAENKERKKAQIIEAATGLILKHGHADFTMPELAERAGVALVTPYSYFQSKAGVLAAVLDPEHALEAAASWNGSADHSDGLTKSMAFAMSRVERYISDAPLYRPVLSTLFKLAPGSAPETQDAEDWLALWEDGLKDAAVQGQIDTAMSTVLVAHTIRNAYLGLLQRWVTQQVTDQQFRLETEATVSMMLAGIAKKPADRKHWHDQFIRTQARMLDANPLDNIANASINAGAIVESAPRLKYSYETK